MFKQLVLQAEKRQVAQLTSAMIPQPATAFVHATPLLEAECCGSANLMVRCEIARLGCSVKGALNQRLAMLECCWAE